MLNTIMMWIGVSVFIISFVKYRMIIKSLEPGKIRNVWIICFVMTVFFLMGYLGQILLDFWEISVVNDKFLIASVYLFGSLYVMFVVSITLYTIRKIQSKRVAGLGIRDKLMKKRIAKMEGLEKKSHDLEAELRKRTVDLEKSKSMLENRVKELERFSKMSVGRELRMMDLKKRIKELEAQLKKKSK